MIKTSDEIRTILFQVYPALTLDRLDLEDREWLLWEPGELEGALMIAGVTHLKFIPVVQECEEFSLHLMSRMRMWEASQADSEKLDKYINRAFGMCRGDLRKLSVTVHKQNIAIIEPDVVVTVEPRTNVITPADCTRYDVWDVLM